MSQTAQDPQTAMQEAAPPAPQTYSPPPAAPPVPPSRRSPKLAAFFSLMPGFGNVYNGLFSRGLLTFLIFFGFFFIVQENNQGPEMALLVPAMIFTWLFGVVDAYRNATLINLGVTELELKNQMPEIKAPDGGLAIGAALFFIGLYGFLTQALEIDMSILFDYWYVILMGFGAWMIYRGYQTRQQDGGSSEL